MNVIQLIAELEKHEPYKEVRLGSPPTDQRIPRPTVDVVTNQGHYVLIEPKESR